MFYHSMRINPRRAETSPMISSEFFDPELLASIAEDVLLGKVAVVVFVLEGRSEVLSEV